MKAFIVKFNGNKYNNLYLNIVFGDLLRKQKNVLYKMP